jgi:hypothetical protein
MYGISDKDAKKLADEITDGIMKHIKQTDDGRIIFVDKYGNEVAEIVGDAEESTKEKTHIEREVIKEASQMSLQKKEERLVINLPAWLKDRLKKRANRTDKSMNEIIRIALTEYLSK